MTNTITLTATSNVLLLHVRSDQGSFLCQLLVGNFVDITNNFSAPSLVQKYTLSGEVMTPLTDVAAGQRFEFLNVEPFSVTAVDIDKCEVEITIADGVGSYFLDHRRINLRYVCEVASDFDID